MLVVQWIIILALAGLVTWLTVDTIVKVVKKVRHRKSDNKQNEVNKDKTE